MVNLSMGKSIGETLREGRMRQRLSITECAKRTHITSHYLEALEEGRWDDLPSESHRVGFLRLYARFLGVPADEILQQYRQLKQTPVMEHPIESTRAAPPVHSEKSGIRLSMVSWQRLCLFGIFGLVLSWGVYHTFRHFRSDTHVDLSWLRFRPRVSSRLTASRHELPVQRIRVTAQSDSWLRVVDNNQLIYEGILPAGAVKTWSSPGPFHIKAGNIDAVALFWNDQPVDLKASAHGHVADVRLPPTLETEKK